jgi:ketosteroid isomerase-like protein
MARKRSQPGHRRASPAPVIGPGRDPAEGSRETIAHELEKLERSDPDACEQRVDDAVEMTFPASDPTAAGRPTGTEPAGRPASRQAPVPTREDIERAAGRRG